MLSGILKAKQKLGVTFNSDKLGNTNLTKFSKLTMCMCGKMQLAKTFYPQLVTFKKNKREVHPLHLFNS